MMLNGPHYSNTDTILQTVAIQRTFWRQFDLTIILLYNVSKASNMMYLILKLLDSQKVSTINQIGGMCPKQGFNLPFGLYRPT